MDIIMELQKNPFIKTFINPNFMNQLRKGALLSYINIALTNVIGLMITPLIVKSLGDSEYGLYILIGSFVGYMSVMDLGLNNTIIRYVSRYRAKKDKIGEENFLAITMLIYMFISAIVIVIGLFLYFNIDRIFENSLTLLELNKAKTMFAILIFNLAFTLPGGAFSAICNGYQQFVYPKALNVIRYVLRSALVIIILRYGSDAIGLVLLDTIINILVIIFNAWYVFKKLKVKLKMHFLDFLLVKEIFSYSIWIFIYAIVLEFQWRSGQVVLGVNTDTRTIAIYGLGILLGSYYCAFAGAINGILLPRATNLSVYSNNSDSYTSDMIKIGKINVLVLLLIISGFYIFGEAFIKLWVGDIYEPAWLIALMIMFVMTLPLTQAYGNSILEAKKKNKFKSILSILTLSCGILIGYFFSKKYGMYGMIYPLLAAVSANSIVMLFYFKKSFGLNIIKFLKDVFGIPLLITINLIIIFRIILLECFLDTWLRLFFAIILFCICYFFLSYLFTFDSKTKSFFKLKG